MVFWRNNNSERPQEAVSCKRSISDQRDQRTLLMHREHNISSRLCRNESLTRMKNVSVQKAQKVKVGGESSVLLSKKSSFFKCKIYALVFYLISHTRSLIICILQDYKYGVNILLCLLLFSSSKAEFSI